MRLFFTILSFAYIAGIFLFAGSPIVSTLSRFNPYSLLHIPLYGILTFLLIFSIVPITQLPNNPMTHKSINSSSHSPIYSFTHRRFLLPGFIALGVAIADEIHQAYVPGRDASAADVLLDALGIILVLFFSSRLLKIKRKAFPH